jgi:rubredoxin
MSEYRYILEPFKGLKTRYRCPNCGKDRKFARYIDTESGEQINTIVGRCDRESNCGYHYTPKQYFADNNISMNSPLPKYQVIPKVTNRLIKPTSFVPVKIFKASLKGYEENNFVSFLISKFEIEVTNELISKYFIATSRHWDGSTVFWQIDIHGNIRTGKIMLYSPITGKRIKEPFNHIYWVHKAIKQPEYELKQCLFGEHLLKDKTKPIAIVESEKTAIISSVYLPQFIWLAVGSLTNLNVEKCQVLMGRNVTLFPDLNGYEKWTLKAKELLQIAFFNVSDLLERNATTDEKKQGLDIADYLLNFATSDFILPEPEPIKQELTLQPLNIETVTATIPANTVLQKTFESDFNILENELMEPNHQKSKSWDKDIEELEAYFKGATLPNRPIKLNSFTTLIDVRIFIDSHMCIVKYNNGKSTYLQYLKRLQQLKQLFTLNLI